MNLSEETKTLLIVGAILLLLYFVYNQDDEPVHNDGAVSINAESTQESTNGSNINISVARSNLARQEAPPAKQVRFAGDVDSCSDESCTENQSEVSGQENISKKFVGKNKAQGKYKSVNYSQGDRSNVSPSEWENYFNDNNQLVADAQAEQNDGFVPQDETNDAYASYKPKTKTKAKQSEEEIFDVDKLLPIEQRADWFETMPDQISVKNRHLINVSRPIGINTIGTSLKNPSYDLRGSPPCPSMIVSPWLQTSISADTNIKSIV